MSDLYPTKTRRDLLGAVDRGNVRIQNGITVRVMRGAVKRRVDALVREQEAAGWVRLGANDVYEVTEIGRVVLDAGGAR